MKGGHHSLSRRITAQKPPRRNIPFTEEQIAFIDSEIERGLSSRQICRMFFRKFGRDLTDGTVSKRRSKRNEQQD